MPAFQQQGLQWVLKSNRLFTTEMTNCRPCQQQFDFGGTVTISFHRRQNPTKKNLQNPHQDISYSSSQYMHSPES